MDCCWTVKKKESEKMDVPPTTLTEKDDMDDQEFMVWLYDHYEERMRRTAKKYCRDEFLWEEILQESFLRLLSRIPKLRTLKEGERAGYLAVTVRNTAFTLLRKQAKERGWCVSLETGALPVEGCLPEEWVIQRERWNTLAAVWPQLAPTERFLLEGRISSREVTGNCQMIWDAGQTAYE